MQAAPIENDQAGNNDIGNQDLPNEEGLAGGTAVFASYKAAGKQKPVSADEDNPFSEETTNKKMRGRPRKIIIPESIGEVNRQTDEEPAASAAAQIKENLKKTPSKTMANKKNLNAENQNDSSWLNGDGQLTVNVFQTENELVLQSAIAGVKVEELDVIIEDDVITIKGNRPNPLAETGDYFIEECYWGPFSRKVILPVEVDSSRADAAMKEGILTIRIPKIQREKKKKLTIKE